MSLLQASNIIPSTLAPVGNSTVSSSSNVNIQWQINGTSLLNYFQIDVMQNNYASTLVHTTGVQQIPTGAYGTDAKGNVTPYTYAPASTTWASWGLTDGNEYKMKIIQLGGSRTVTRLSFNSGSQPALAKGSVYYYLGLDAKYHSFTSPANVSALAAIDIFPGNLIILNYASTLADSSRPALIYTYTTDGMTAGATYLIWNGSESASVNDCVIQNYVTAFYTRTAPILIINPIPDSTITDISYTFRAVFSQAQHDSISWVRWILSKSDGTTVDDTGKITTGVLSYTYDGLYDGTDYTVTCIVESQYGVQVSASASFTVEYNINTDTQSITSVCTYDSDGSATLEWSIDTTMHGTASGAVTYDGSFVQIPSGTTVTWTPTISFLAPYQIVWSGEWNRAPATLTTLLSINESQNLTVGLSTVLFNGHFVTVPSGAANAKYATILIRSIGIAIWFYGENGNRMYDCDTISYDSTGLADTISSLKLSGTQSCDWLCVSTNVTASYAYGNNSQKPTLNNDMYFFADFNNSLDANGTATGDSPESSTWHVYRENIATGSLLQIATVSGDIVSIKDYGIRSNELYSYRILLRSSNNVWVTGIESARICKRLTSFYLYEAEEDENDANVFHVIKTWRFGNNYSGGSVSNGNAPEFLTNFTKYPLRQGSTIAAKSGTLTALLSNFSGLNSYQDTAAQMEELYNLSLSQNHIFLKDTKGNLYEIHTSAPISQTVNTLTAPQEVTISLPWQEIADASNVSLYGSAPIMVEPLEISQDGEYAAPTGRAYTPVTVSVEPTVYGELLSDSWGGES